MLVVGFELALESRVELIGVVDVEGVVMAIQFEALADGRQCVLDCAGSNLVATAESSLPCPFSKSQNEGNLFFRSESLEIGVETGPKECAPVMPITVALHVVHCHDTIEDMAVRSAE